jgi:hypothetical protein
MIWQNFNRLYHYLFSRIHCKDENKIYSDQQANRVVIVKERLYVHKTLRIHYTTYDLQRSSDYLNPSTDAHAIVRTDEEAGYKHRYCRIILVFHVLVRDAKHPERGEKRRDVCFVRWLRPAEDFKSGFEIMKPPRVEFFDKDDASAFGFINPKNIIRRVHMQNDGDVTTQFLGQIPSHLANQREFTTPDYRYYTVGM